MGALVLPDAGVWDQDKATCTLEGGEASCECNPGFTGDGLFCADINECETLENNPCSVSPCFSAGHDEN